MQYYSILISILAYVVVFIAITVWLVRETTDMFFVHQEIRGASGLSGAVAGGLFWLLHPGGHWFPWNNTGEFWVHALWFVGLVTLLATLLISLSVRIVNRKIKAWELEQLEEEYLRYESLKEHEAEEAEEFFNSFPPGTYQRWDALFNDPPKEEDENARLERIHNDILDTEDDGRGIPVDKEDTE